MLRPMILGFLLTLPLMGAPALRDIAAYRQGMEALDSELWDIANNRFEQTLQTTDISPTDKRLVELRRIEAWIRGDKPAQALAKLAEPAFANDPETYFWKAQAQAGLGHYSEAIESLTPALENPKAAHRNEALLTRASLQVALDDQDGARLTLETLAKTGDAKMLRLAKLRQTAILLDQGKIPGARKLLPDPKSLDETERSERDFLNARLLLAEGKAAEASTAFAILRDQAQGQSLPRYHEAVVGLADAYAADGNTDGAADLLLGEIQKQKDSPLLDAVFKRLLQWLPDHPAPHDTILVRLTQWIPPDLSVPNPLLAASVEKDKSKDTSGAANAWPSAPLSHPEDLSAYAMFTQAIGLHRQDTPETKAQANVLMNRILWEYPNHPLASRAQLQLGRWYLEEGRADRAFATLASIRQSNNPAPVRGEAAFLEARSEFERGHPEAAAALFDEAANLIPDRAAETAALNAALSRLKSGAIAAIPRSANPDRDARIRADLDLERALAESSPEAATESLKQFIHNYPIHPRNGEARLAAATAALQMHPADTAFAREEVETISLDPALKSEVSAESVAWLRALIADQTDNPADAIRLSRVYLAAHADGPHAADATMQLGRNLFRNGDYHNARLVLEKLAASAPTAPLAPAALMLAARAAALGATDQSREESLALFDRVAKGSSALSPLARLERARLLINLKRLDAVLAELQPWYQSMKPGDPLKVPAGLLIGEALYAQGSEKPGSLPSALAIYDQLLVAAKDQPAVIHRLHYLRGMVLEQLPHPTVTGATREGDALESYVSVLQAADDHPPAEWEWFERCGFRALALLEKAGKWRPAVKIATKISSFKGPRAGEAAERAKGLRLEHMIWEE